MKEKAVNPRAKKLILPQINVIVNSGKDKWSTKFLDTINWVCLGKYLNVGLFKEMAVDVYSFGVIQLFN